MFKNEYQGGTVFELFSAHGKDPVAKWKLSGGQSCISKVFDKEVKGFVYSLEGSSQIHKMQIPKDGKMPLGLVQKFLVLQVNIPLGKDFSAELVVTDIGHLKRRLYFSTVQRELSATPLHARIPLTNLRCCVWCNLSIDVASFTAKMFRGTGFLSLDGITVSACCKVRKIFTMRSPPVDSSHPDLYFGGDTPGEEIPKSCQFPAEVQHVTQVVNMDTMGLADVRICCGSADGEQYGLVKSASSRGLKIPDMSHIAFGSKVTGPPPQTARKSNTSAPIHEKKSEVSHRMLSGQSRNLQPHPPSDRASAEKAGLRRPRLLSAGGDKPVQGALGGPTGRGREQGEIRTNPDAQPVCLALSATFATEDTTAVRMASIETTETSDEEPEEEEEEEDEVFIFSSRPHSAKRGTSAHCPPLQDLTFDLNNHERGGERKEARPEDDFISSETEEDEARPHVLLQRHAPHAAPAPPHVAPASPRPAPSAHPPVATPTAQSPSYAPPPLCADGSGRARPLNPVPTRCKSPSGTKRNLAASQPEAGRSRGALADTAASISRSSLREIPTKDLWSQRGMGGARPSPLGSSNGDLQHRQAQEEGEEEEEEVERRMLASLCREQEEEAGVDLSPSQLHRCNVSLSISSDDTSTWTQCLPVPAEQGQHYQKEMNPLLHSDPREWLDVLSPPILHPAETCESNRVHRKAMTRGTEAGNGGNEEEFLSLLYDPCLNCYFDPQSGKYYELA